jgi:hypothetical protein
VAALPTIALAALPVLPWFIRSAIMTGNPFFPLFARIIPSRDLSPAMAALFEDYNRYMLWASRAGASWSREQRQLILAGAALAVVVAALLAAVSGLQGGGSVSEIFRAQQNEFVGRVLADSGQLLFSAADQGLYELQIPPK